MQAWRVMLLIILPLLGATGAHSQPSASSTSSIRSAVPAGGRITLQIKPGTRLSALLALLQKYTNALIQVEEKARRYVESYVMPPYLVGEKQFSSVSAALDFLFGAGWEGSLLPEEQRTAENANYQLARTPFMEEQPPGTWVCNNRAFDWSITRKTVRGKPTVVVTIRKRLYDDGDIVPTQPVDLGGIEDDFTLLTVLERLKLKSGITVNVIGEELITGRGPEDDRSPIMRVASIPPPLREELSRPITPGRLLTLLAIGLNEHTKDIGGDWKWSSAYASSSENTAPPVIYTLRDYAHYHPGPVKREGSGEAPEKAD